MEQGEEWSQVCGAALLKQLKGTMIYEMQSYSQQSPQATDTWQLMEVR